MVGQRDVAEGEATSGGGIRNYAETNAATLDKPTAVLGGWGHLGTVFLDVPKGFPVTPQGEVAARRSTLAQNQKAYGHMGPERTYEGTTYNPFHEEHRDFNSAGHGGPRRVT